MGAAAAADAVHLRLHSFNFVCGGGDDAVYGFDHGHLRMGHSKAHHGAAHNDPGHRGRLVAALGQNVRNRGAERDPGVHFVSDGITGHGDHSSGKRLPPEHCLSHGKGGGNVVHHHAVGCGPGAVGDLNAGDDSDKVPGGSRRVLHRDFRYPDILKSHFRDFGLQGADGLGFVVFDGDNRKAGLQNVSQNVDAPENIFGVFLHEPVIAGNVGLAFRPVDDQKLAVLRLNAGAQLGLCGEPGAAQSGNAHAADMVKERIYRNLGIGGVGGVLIDRAGGFLIGFKNNAGLGQSAGVGDGSLSNGGYRAGHRSMHRYLPIIGGRGERLIFEHMLPRFHQHLGGAAGMLLQGDHQSVRNAESAALESAGAALVFIGVHAALKGIKNAV